MNTWIDDLLHHVITQWDDEGQPPVIGKNEDEIIRGWSKLRDFDVDSFYNEKHNVVKNFSKMASGINQFFPSTLRKSTPLLSVWARSAPHIKEHWENGRPLAV